MDACPGLLDDLRIDIDETFRLGCCWGLNHWPSELFEGLIDRREGQRGILSVVSSCHGSTSNIDVVCWLAALNGVHEEIRRHLFLSHVCGIVRDFCLNHERCALQYLLKLGGNMELLSLSSRSRYFNDWCVHFST